MEEITIIDNKKNKCRQCGYEWGSKDPDKKPVQCPRCKRYDWEVGKND